MTKQDIIQINAQALPRVQSTMYGLKYRIKMIADRYKKERESRPVQEDLERLRTLFKNPMADPEVQERLKSLKWENE